MFANNQKISHRQVLRQMVLSLAAPILLCLPGTHHILGANGLLGILVNLAIYSFFILVLIRIAPAYQDLPKTLGAAQGRCVALLYQLPLILAGAYLLAITSRMVCTYLITGVPRWLAGLLILGVCAVGSHMGLEKRARMGEVSCCLVVGGFLLLYLLACFQGDSTYVNNPVQGSLRWPDSAESAYALFCAWSFLGFLPFLLPRVSDPDNAWKPVFAGLAILGGLLGVALVLSQAVFGWGRLVREEFPILPLMAGTNLPGDILARFDVLWIALLVYGMFFSLGSIFFYGSHILGQARLRTLGWWPPLLAYGIAFGSFGGYQVEEWFGWLLTRVLTPLILALTAYVGARGRD